MPTRIYSLTPAQVETIREAIPTLPAGNSGTFNPPDHPEVDLGYSYDGVASLTICVLEDAWYETAGEIWHELDKYMPAGSLPVS